MSLIWHIAKKDIRRMALPVALWLAFVVASAIWFAVSAGTGMVLTAADVGNWAGMRVLVGLFTIIQSLICYFLVGAMVIEEPLVGSSALWMTRPISNLRRAAATGVSALVMFVVTPVLMQVVFWSVLQFSGYEVSVAALDFFQDQLVIVVLALSVAAICRNLAQFLFCSVGLLLAYGICRFHFLDSGHDFRLQFTHDRIIVAGLVPTSVIVLVHQFLTRRVVRTWAIVGVAVLAALAVRRFWPWEKPTIDFALPSLRQIVDHARRFRLDDGIGIQVFTDRDNGWNRWPKRVEATLAAHSSAIPIPLDGTIEVPSADDATIVDLKLAKLRDDDVARLAVGQPIASVHWELVAVRGPFALPPDESPEIRVNLNGSMARIVAVDVLPEPPHEISDGGRQTRIVVTEPENDGGAQVLIQDRDAFPNGFLLRTLFDVGNIPTAFRHRDIFALVNPTTREVRALRCEEMAAVAFDGMVTGFRRLSIPPELRNEPWRTANIVRVRLELGDSFYANSDVNLSNQAHRTP